ncbi:MAG: hypothetical protein ACRDJX_11210, partial [Solirubrobacteraceae bacterium]
MSVVLVGSLAFGCVPAPAAAERGPISQRGHVYSFAFGAKGKGDGEFSDPSGVAVNDATGEVYVADVKNKRVQEFEPVVSEAGALVGEDYAGQFALASDGVVAVDDSTEAGDPSRGDVYVVGKAANVLYKFSSEGAPIGTLKKFGVAGVKERFEAIEGVAVDADGSVFVYQEDGAIYTFNDSVANTAEASLQTGLGRKGEPGFALDSEGDFYAGVEGEGGFPVVAKLEGITGKVLIAALDGEKSTGVAVNTTDVAGNEVDEQNDVYVDNAARVAQLAPEAAGKPGAVIQRFPSAGESEAHGGPIVHGSHGIAVDDRTGTVFVSDSTADDLDVFELEASGRPTVDSLSAHSVVASPPLSSVMSFQAQIDPMGAQTSYYFEYGAASCAATPSACVTTPVADIGEGFGDQQQSLELEDLAPGTYHYRVLAENALGTVESPERTFTILASSSGLLDGRAWEMVSPPDKHGAEIEALTNEGGVILAAEDGDALAYVANGAITEEPQGNRSPEMQQVLATRGAGGWSSQDIATPNDRAEGVSAGSAPEYQFFTPD